MNPRVFPLLVSIVVVSLAGCSKHDPQAQAGHDHAPAYAAVARGRVTVQGGLLTVFSPIAGSLSAVNVHEGEHVRAHQVLARLDDATAKAVLDTAKAQLQQALAQKKLLSLQQSAARKQARRETAAAAAGVGAGQTADTATARVSQLGARSAAAVAAIAVARARLQNVRYNLSRHALRAPFAAWVVHVLTQKGASINAQSSPLFVLLPDRPRIVRAELNASYVHAIHAGMHARVSLDDQQAGTSYAAHVLRVGRIFSRSKLDEDPATQATQRTVECVLAFDKPSSLRIGRRVLVRFLPDKHGTNR